MFVRLSCLRPGDVRDPLDRTNRLFGPLVAFLFLPISALLFYPFVLLALAFLPLSRLLLPFPLLLRLALLLLPFTLLPFLLLPVPLLPFLFPSVLLLLLRLCLLVQTLAQRLCPRAQIASGGRLRILAERLVSVADRCGVIVLRQAGLATSKDPSHRFSAFTGSRGAFELQPAEGGLLLLLSAPRFDGAYVLAKRRQRFRDQRMRWSETLESPEGARVVLRVEETACVVDGLDGAAFVFLARPSIGECGAHLGADRLRFRVRGIQHQRGVDEAQRNRQVPLGESGLRIRQRQTNVLASPGGGSLPPPERSSIRRRHPSRSGC